MRATDEEFAAMKTKNPNAKQSARLWLNYSGAGGYLNSDKFIAHITDVAEIIRHRKNFANEEHHVGFDQSPIHTCGEPGGLYPARMRKRDNQKSQPIMNPGILRKDVAGRDVLYHFQRDDGSKKGLLTVCKELGLVTGRELPKKITAEKLRAMLETHPMFATQKSRVEALLESYGIHCFFTTKCHPELSPIELCWSQWKHKLEEAHGVDIATVGLTFEQRCEKHLNRVSALDIARCCRHARLYAVLYSLGADGVLAKHAAQRYTSHRRNPPKAVAAVLESFAEFAARTVGK